VAGGKVQVAGAGGKVARCRWQGGKVQVPYTDFSATCNLQWTCGLGWCVAERRGFGQISEVCFFCKVK